MDMPCVVELQLIDRGEFIENGKTTAGLRIYDIGGGQTVLGVEELDQDLKQYKELNKFKNPFILKIVDISQPFTAEPNKRVMLYRDIDGSLEQDVSDLFHTNSENSVDLSSFGKKFVKCCARAINFINKSHSRYLLSLERNHIYFYRESNGDWIPQLGIFSFGVINDVQGIPSKNWISFGNLLENLALEIGQPHSELSDLINNLKIGVFSKLTFVLRHSSVWELPHICNLLLQLVRALAPILKDIRNQKKKNEENPHLTYKQRQVNFYLIKPVVWKDWKRVIHPHLKAGGYDDNMGGFLKFWRERIIYFNEEKSKNQHQFSDKNHLHDYLRSLRSMYLNELLNWAIKLILDEDMPAVFNLKIYHSELE